MTRRCSPLMMAFLVACVPLAAAGSHQVTFSDLPADTYYAPAAPGATVVDILAVTLRDDGDALQATTELLDLSLLPVLGRDPGYSAQYAVVVHTTKNPDGFQIHAVFGGAAYTGVPGGAWRFLVLDYASGEWADVTGTVEGNGVTVNVPHEHLGHPVAGDRAYDLHAQAWSHGALGLDPQVGDFASAPEGASLTFA